MKTAECIRYMTAATKYGDALVARSGQGICAILLDAESKVPNATLARRFPKAEFVLDSDLTMVAQKIARYIDDPTRPFDEPLDIRGTPFQKAVWQALMQVPCGKTASYTDIANAVGAPKAVRAVGAACGANMHAIVIPCHRIVRSDGALAGFRWGGKDNKHILIEAEIVRNEAC